MLPFLFTFYLTSCASEDQSDSESNKDQNAEADQDQSEEEHTKTWLSADLAPLSSGECPDMSTSGTQSTFTSSGEERNVTIVYPSNPTEQMKAVFFYHGLMSPQQTPKPTEYMASGLGLQNLADDENTIIVLPESKIWSLLGQDVFMWDIEDGTYDKDIALFDDLRTCLSDNFDVDLDRFGVLGFSGGSLFTTIVISQRADTLAAAVELSGGADIEAPLFEELLSPYETPSHQVPSLLISGGDTDVWPSTDFVIIDFAAATDTLATELVQDGHLVYRCHHNSGHTITNNAFTAATAWLSQHVYGTTSAYAEGEVAWSDWCDRL